MNTNSQSNGWHQGYKEVVKRRCHSCKCEVAESLLVPCKMECCHKFFCLKCLTSRYKYSKAKASTLPSINWKCPVCTRRCYCNECVSAGNIPKKKKSQAKRNLYSVRRRMKKKVRPKSKTGMIALQRANDVVAKCRIGGRESTTAATVPSPCIQCQDSSNMMPNRMQNLIPVITNDYVTTKSSYMFAQALALKDAYSDISNSLNPMKRSWNQGTLFPILNAETYAQMTAMECMKIGFIPFTTRNCFPS